MSDDEKYSDMLDDNDDDIDDTIPEEEPPRVRNPGSNKERERDYRRAIEDLREQKRLQAELSAYDLDADGDDDL